MENAWICFSLCLDEAQCCKSAMHFVRMCGVGFCGVWKIEEIFEDTFICVSYSVFQNRTHEVATGEIEFVATKNQTTV
jgi:hypothetical protein